MSDWDDSEPLRTLTFLQVEEMKASREQRLPEYDDLLERVVAICGSERRAMIAISRAAGTVMATMAGADAQRVEDFLLMKALGAAGGA